LSIDRNNVDGNYCPENCTWENQKEQCNNMTTNILITYKNKTLTASQWIDELHLTSIDINTIREHWKKGIRGKALFGINEAFTQKLIKANGEIKTVKEWSKLINISVQSIKKDIIKD
jgi:hypothetical protein